MQLSLRKCIEIVSLREAEKRRAEVAATAARQAANDSAIRAVAPAARCSRLLHYVGQLGDARPASEGLLPVPRRPPKNGEICGILHGCLASWMHRFLRWERAHGFRRRPSFSSIVSAGRRCLVVFDRPANEGPLVAQKF